MKISNLLFKISLLSILGITNVLFALNKFPHQQDQSLKGCFLVAKNNCGEKDEQPHLINGSNWRFDDDEIDVSKVPSVSPFRSVVHGQKVHFRISGLVKNAAYKLRILYLSDDKNRIQSFSIDSIKIQDRLTLPDSNPLTFIFDVPKLTYRDGTINLYFEKIAGPNAVVSQIELWSSVKRLGMDLQIKAQGNFKGEISGEVWDKNTGQSLPEVTVKIKSVEKTVRSTTDESGKFSVSIPESWRNGNSKFVEIKAFMEKSEKRILMSTSEVFLKPIQLTPVPANVHATKNCRIDLNGKWYFNPSPIGKLPQKLETLSQSWSQIKVPGEWVMQGFEVKPNSFAGYFRKFFVPRDWLQHRTKLRCDAVYSVAKVFINGDFIGKHHGGFTPFEFDVSAYLQPGRENSIAILVKNESLADTLASGTQYAAHQLGGITRKIYLFAVPEINLSSFHVETVFDEEFQNAKLTVDVVFENKSHDDFEGNVSVQLIDKKIKKPVLTKTFKISKIEKGEKLKQSLILDVPNPRKWDCEHPNLYELKTTLLSNKNELEVVKTNIGFRQIEVRGNRIFINNKPVKLRGINRHEVHPLLGRSLTPELWRKDAELFREANINYIRTSHYPPAEEFIQACDELGLFVECEAPLVWIGHGANAAWQNWDTNNARFFPVISQAILEMIESYRNHPSIILWSLANESAWGRNWQLAFQTARNSDSTRPFTFHDQAWGGYNNYGSDSMPVGNYHYPGPTGPEKITNSKRPIIFGEYCHLNTYNREEIVTDPGVRDFYGVALAPMWEKMWNSRGCLGGAIWSGVDDIFYLPSGKHVGYGSWGPIDGWRRKKPEYWHIKKSYSPIKLVTKKITNLSPGLPIEIKIQNRHDFTNLNEIKIFWELGDKNGIIQVDLEPHEEGRLKIAAFEENKKAENLRLKFYSPRGFLIDEFLLPICEKAKINETKKESSTQKIKVEKTSKEIRVIGDHFKWVFSTVTGKIIRGEIDDQTIITGGPRLMILPLKSGTAKTEHSKTIPPLNDYCSQWLAEDVVVKENEYGINLKTVGQYSQASGFYEMEIKPTGELQINYEFIVSGEVNPRQIGIVFDLPASFNILSWKRDAQWTVYPEDHIGRPNGVAYAFVKQEVDVSNRQPNWAWFFDRNELGSNDFRSTKMNIFWGKLFTQSGLGIKTISNGKQHIRAFLQNNQSHLLVSGFTTGGADVFLNSHYKRQKLAKGSRIQDSVLLSMTKNGGY